MPQIAKSGTSLRVSGAMTMETVNALLDESRAAIEPGTQEVDLSGVSEVDSAALGLVFEWLRQNASLVFVNLPANLVSLATLYGVLDFIPQQHSHSH